MLKLKEISIVLLAWLSVGCMQSDPSFPGREGDVLTFSGRKWQIKSGNSLLGPGPNYFSSHPNDVFIDENGYLHLTITQRSGRWYSTEVISQDTMGYGTYIFTIQGDPVNLDPDVVLGLFTWDDSTFQTQANSEVDIEFAKWGEDTVENTLQYGVQPIAFGPYNPERVHKPEEDNQQWIGLSTHAFTWTDTLITWQSWVGNSYQNGLPVSSWTFDLDNPARIKYEGPNESDPVVIPAPGRHTNARMNYWLLTGPEGPVVPTRKEMIIQKFEYIPL